MVPDMDQVIAEMVDAGFTDEEFISVIRTDGAHSEWFWKRELDDALLWLFEGVMPLEVIQEQAEDFVVYDSVGQQVIVLPGNSVTYTLFSINGTVVSEGTLSGEPLSCKTLTSGTYIFYYNTSQHYYALKIIVP
jgi:hypothetical protein